ncbi:MAG: glycosyltransferase, partial [Candidatus Firestonebacteria bacterium]|nr:glycosyltransferase [Candidatus Firestonebacteria bacterium]
MNNKYEKELSIIIPLFNEAPCLQELFSEVSSAVIPLNIKYEIIFVDDGSLDNSFSVLKEIHEKYPSIVKIIQFRKNYGKSAALSEGFKLALGKIIITMDADLQDDPKEIPNFLNTINEGYDLTLVGPGRADVGLIEGFLTWTFLKGTKYTRKDYLGRDSVVDI